MPRQARKQSSSGIYHIMLRGVNQQIIFEDEEDKEKFMQTLKRYKEISCYEIYGYCLMANHIHLLIRAGKENVDLVIKRIAGSYVYWYNWKYKRSGHLFQDRFKSEPVEDDSYFLTVLRYIHQNPIKGGICKKVSDYKFSSYSDYINDSELVDTDFCLSIIGKEQFIQFNNERSNEECLDIEDKSYRLTDDEAKRIIQKISKCKTTTEFLSLDIEKRNKYLRLCRKQGISIRQLSRLTGVSFNIIRKID